MRSPPPSSVQNGFQTAASYSLDINSPIDRLYTNARPSKFTFDDAHDHLRLIASVMRNHVMRQHGFPLPSASSIIALLEHISQTVKVAFSRIGYQLPVENSDSLHYTSDQKQLETTLSLVYNDWIRFIKKAQNQCERSRGKHPPTPLGEIVKGSKPPEMQSQKPERKKPPPFVTATSTSGRPVKLYVSIHFFMECPWMLISVTGSSPMMMVNNTRKQSR